MNCPHCASDKIGHRNGKQSYLCRDCRRQFLLDPIVATWDKAFSVR
ncbi:MAG: IS1 family transposase [Leptolyngbyaceae cyanobacterium SU_3_3]|nr:IS1 family transposase [Leptolyngbyaceae cyanobacterium SU_3_3]NJR51169.1 IS1 family transposase [Leptolyngbyaceae cyanobacterium CSU_1_3]